MANHALRTNYSSISEAFPQLSGLTPNPSSSLPISLGGQNFTHCCLLAVNSSLTINNGLLEILNTSVIESNISTFHSSQFGCGAKYIGDPSGAPVVSISYDWCTSNCGGWEISQ